MAETKRKYLAETVSPMGGGKLVESREFGRKTDALAWAEAALSGFGIDKVLVHRLVLKDCLDIDTFEMEQRWVRDEIVRERKRFVTKNEWDGWDAAGRPTNVAEWLATRPVAA